MKKLPLLLLFHPHVNQFPPEAFPMSGWHGFEVFHFPCEQVTRSVSFCCPNWVFGFHQCPCDCSVSWHSPCSFLTGHQFQFIFRFCDPMNWHFLQVFHGPENRCFVGTVFPSPVNDFSHYTLSEPWRLFVQSISSLLSLIPQSSWLLQCHLKWVSTISMPLRIGCVMKWWGSFTHAPPHVIGSCYIVL